MSLSDPLDQAIQAIHSGEIGRARALLTQILRSDSQRAQAWFWLAACWSEPEKQRFCLERAASLSPGDPEIRQALERFSALYSSAPTPDRGVELDATQQPSPEVAAPVVQAEPTQVEGAPSSQAPAVSPSSTAESTPRQPKPTRPRRKSRSCSVQMGALILLGLLALISILALLLLLTKTDLLASSFNPPGSRLRKTPLEAPVFQMPPTWTPTSSPTPAPTPFKPTATPIPTASPVASLTPYSGDWRFQIGRSVQDRPIEVYRFGIGPHERLIVAGIHGGSEAVTIALADQLIKHLKENPKLVSPQVSLFILRSLNPDGEALYDKPQARYNAHGVDLNRNFPVNWKSAWGGQSCNPLDVNTAGAEPASEPETRAFMKFLTSRKIEMLIHYHSGGKGLLPGGSPADPESVELARRIAAISPYPYPPPAAGCEYTGTLVDWAVSQGAAAVDLELSSKTEMDLTVNLQLLELLLNWEP